ncbi:MAG: YobI family P-loop NTPase [Ginsengibacter sp.]
MYLKKISGWIEKKYLVKGIVTNNTLTSLAPKIITDPAELKKIEYYLESLKRAISTNEINNIALTGSYGSGKSTILKTFKYYHPEYKYLNISLASFKDNKEDKEGFERKLEISILQQIFYHVKPSAIPDSRFKRIVNLTTTQLLFQTLFVLSWVVSIILLFKFDYIEKLNPRSWSHYYSIDWFFMAVVTIFLSGIAFFVKSIVRLFTNSKINKLNIKGEVELGKADDKSIFNQHLDEILYYFEKTPFDVVIIEDIDRFDNTDIFTKLREINILINYSDLVNRKVSFVYAVRDDIFTDSYERVKFFEYIIPVIPFINPSNASEQLSKLKSAANLETVLSKDFTEDVVTFIDQIDMRMLINIFHEFLLYRSVLSPDLDPDEMFAMIVYKNMFPEDFDKLPKRDGRLFKFLSDKPKYTGVLTEKIQNQIKEKETEISNIERERIDSLRELRAIYVTELISALPSALSINGIELPGLINEENFKKIVNHKGTLFYSKLSNNYGYNYSLSSNITANFTFTDIEKKVNEGRGYLQRETLLLGKINNKVNSNKEQIEVLRKNMRDIESLSLKEIFMKLPIGDYLGDFKENSLIRNLLLNGYINENYNDYISVFHEVNLTAKDFTFERKVKSGVMLPFDYTLTKTESLVKRLPGKYFRREEILNFDLIDKLFEINSKYPEKFKTFFELLSGDSENIFRFIIEYIDRAEVNQKIFIKQLLKFKKNLWEQISASALTEKRIRKLIKRILIDTDIDDILAQIEIKSLGDYLSEMPDFLAYSASFGNKNNLETFIKKQNVLFEHLDEPTHESNKTLQFIIENNLYQITIKNLETISRFLAASFNLDEFRTSNFTSLKKLQNQKIERYIDNHIAVYFDNVLLSLSENANETENSIIELLNKTAINLDQKRAFLQLQVSKISSLDSIQATEVKELVLGENKVIATWQNVSIYFNELEEKELDESLAGYLNIEDNFSVLSVDKLNSTILGKDDDDIEEFCRKIIYCKNLKPEAYSSLLESIPYEYDTLEFATLETNQIIALIEKNIVLLTPESFSDLKKSHPTLRIDLLGKFEDEFLENLSDFSLTSEDWFLLFKSDKFSLDGKLELLKKIDDNIIVNNAFIAKTVCQLLPADKYIPFRYEVIEALVESGSSVQKKIELLNLHMENLTDAQVEALTQKVGEDYERIFIKQNKPVFPDIDFNRRFVGKLKQRGLISSYSLNEKKGEIKVVANYSG